MQHFKVDAIKDGEQVFIMDGVTFALFMRKMKEVCENYKPGMPVYDSAGTVIPSTKNPWGVQLLTEMFGTYYSEADGTLNLYQKGKPRSLLGVLRDNGVGNYELSPTVLRIL